MYLRLIPSEKSKALDPDLMTLTNQYHQKNTCMSPMMKPNAKQFKVTYKDAEAPVLVPVEYQMMKEIGCSRSDLHKIAIREMHNRRQRSTLHFI